jgi:hypothetical protein
VKYLAFLAVTPAGNKKEKIGPVKDLAFLAVTPERNKKEKLVQENN